MKVLIKIIISLFFLFSIFTPSFAQKGYIENILDLNYGIEDLKINLSTIDNYYFNDYSTYRIHDTFKRASVSLKNEIIKKYKNQELGYYQTNGIIKNYNNFIYYSNKYFYFKKQKETYINNKVIDNAIIDNLTQAKSYYMRMKYLILK